MQLSRIGIRLAAIAGGISLLVVGTALAYWQVSRNYHCVRTLSSGNQEATYSWGCMRPQRYRQSVTTAQAHDED